MYYARTNLQFVYTSSQQWPQVIQVQFWIELGLSINLTFGPSIESHRLESYLTSCGSDCWHYGRRAEVQLNWWASSQVLPNMDQLISQIAELVKEYADAAMLARTHGQPASPTTMGKELAVFAFHLKQQREKVRFCRRHMLFHWFQRALYCAARSKVARHLLCMLSARCIIHKRNRTQCAEMACLHFGFCATRLLQYWMPVLL